MSLFFIRESGTSTFSVQLVFRNPALYAKKLATMATVAIPVDAANEYLIPS